jgi:hypothetical protein
MNDEASAYVEIQRLQRHYADLATRGAYDEVTMLATPDALFTFDTYSGDVFEVRGAAEFAAFAQRTAGGFRFFEYIPLNFTVTFESEDFARGRSYTLEVSENESGEWLEFFGTYRDEYTRYEGEWRFSKREYATYGRRTAGRLEAFPLQF